MKRKYPMLVEEGDGMLFGRFPDLDGVTTAGKTKEELLYNATAVLEEVLGLMNQEGESAPEASTVINVEVTLPASRSEAS